MTELLDKICQAARADGVPIMLEDTAVLLLKTLEKKKPRTILEIGTAVGYSGILMLSACPEAKLYTVEINEAVQECAKENFQRAGLLDRVTFWTGDAAEIARYLSGKFDFVLMDGPKGHYLEMLPYIDGATAVGGTIFADNVLFKGYTLAQRVGHKHRTIVNSLRGFIDALSNDKNYRTNLFEIGDGVLIAEKI